MPTLREVLALQLGGAIEDPLDLDAAEVRDREQVAAAQCGRFAGDVHPLTLAAAARRRDPP
jgi:hypothetical protein